jgi:4-hydroxymandelate oxidase
MYGQLDPFRDHSRIPTLAEMKTIFDFEPVCWAKIARAAYIYLAYGSDGEFTLRRNREAFGWAETVPRRFTTVTKPQTAVELFGMKMDYPMMIAPHARHIMFDPDAEASTHKAATAAANTPMIVSNVATFPLEKIAPAADGPWIFQLYPQPGPTYNAEWLANAQKLGCKAVVLTMDQTAAEYDRAQHSRNLATPLNPTPIPVAAGRREALPQNPYRVTPTRLWYTWDGLADDVRRMVKVPLIAKGVVCAEDVELCLKHKFDGIYVSNHGGRSLDYQCAALESLPEIVEAVKGRVPVLFDSGIRSGEDMFKALAIGANCVCIGRAILWGLAAYGVPGAQKALEILQAELVQAMIANGCPTVASIDKTVVRTEFL